MDPMNYMWDPLFVQSSDDPSSCLQLFLHIQASSIFHIKDMGGRKWKSNETAKLQETKRLQEVKLGGLN